MGAAVISAAALLIGAGLRAWGLASVGTDAGLLLAAIAAASFYADRAARTSTKQAVQAVTTSRWKHDMRSPLHSVLGFSALLRDPRFGELNDKQNHFVSQVERSAKNLMALVEATGTTNEREHLPSSDNHQVVGSETR